MAVDSIIAKPTKSVLVMVADASGCCANEESAIATALPSPNEGPMTPIAMVRPAVTIEMMAMRVILSMVYPLVAGWVVFVPVFGLRTRVAAAMYTVARILKM